MHSMLDDGWIFYSALLSFALMPLASRLLNSDQSTAKLFIYVRLHRIDFSINSIAIIRKKQNSKKATKKNIFEKHRNPMRTNFLLLNI